MFDVSVPGMFRAPAASNLLCALSVPCVHRVRIHFHNRSEGTTGHSGPTSALLPTAAITQATLSDDRNRAKCYPGDAHWFGRSTYNCSRRRYTSRQVPPRRPTNTATATGAGGKLRRRLPSRSYAAAPTVSIRCDPASIPQVAHLTLNVMATNATQVR